jgi:hypothetical protein
MCPTNIIQHCTCGNVIQVVKLTASSLEGIHVHLAGAAASAACITTSLSRFVSAAANERLSEGAAAVTLATPQQHQLSPPQPTAYSSGKLLSEETRYCLERRRLEQQVHSLYQLTVAFVCNHHQPKGGALHRCIAASA